MHALVTHTCGMKLTIGIVLQKQNELVNAMLKGIMFLDTCWQNRC